MGDASFRAGAAGSAGDPAKSRTGNDRRRGTIIGRSGADVIVGSAGVDTHQRAWDGDDVICGEGGNDVINGDLGDDVLDR